MIIGIAGKARMGKDTLANYLQEEFRWRDAYLHITAFAEQLKWMCGNSFGLSKEQLYGDKKEEPDFRFPRTLHGSSQGIWSAAWTPREIMQAVGSFYRSIDKDFWVKALDNNIKIYEIPNATNIAISDIRHVNECEYVKKKGILIKIVRGKVEKVHGSNHESEISLDDKPDNYFDLVVDNNGSLDDLRDAVPNIVEAIMVLNKLKEEGRDYNAKR
jgi:hypothetical protein